MFQHVTRLFVPILLSLGCFAPAAMAATPLKGWVLENNEYPNHQGMLRFFELLKQKSQSRFEGQTLWRQELGAQKDVVPKFKKGEIDFAVLSNVALTEAVPEMEVLSLPFLFSDQEHMLRVLDGGIGMSLEESLAKKGYIVLAWYNGGSRSFYSRSKPLRFSTDFEKLRMRVANRESMISMVKALGGVPSTMAFDKVGDALKNGELDAAENDILSYEITEHYKIAPWFVFSHHNVLPEALVVFDAALGCAQRCRQGAGAHGSA
ncbi:MAG: TRAP transporter substrate-binding protein DctP [Rhodocyclaceae bacterium]